MRIAISKPALKFFYQFIILRPKLEPPVRWGAAFGAQEEKSKMEFSKNNSWWIWHKGERLEIKTGISLPYKGNWSYWE